MKFLSIDEKCKLSLKKTGRIKGFRKALLSLKCDLIIEEKEKDFNEIHTEEWEKLLNLIGKINKPTYENLRISLELLGRVPKKVFLKEIKKKGRKHEAIFYEKGVYVIYPERMSYTSDVLPILKFLENNDIIEEYYPDIDGMTYHAILSPNYKEKLKKIIEEQLESFIKILTCEHLMKKLKYEKCKIKEEPFFAKLYKKVETPILYKSKRILEDYYRCVNRCYLGKEEEVHGGCLLEIYRNPRYFPYKIPFNIEKGHDKWTNIRDVIKSRSTRPEPIRISFLTRTLYCVNYFFHPRTTVESVARKFVSHKFPIIAFPYKDVCATTTCIADVEEHETEEGARNLALSIVTELAIPYIEEYPFALYDTMYLEKFVNDFLEYITPPQYDHFYYFMIALPIGLDSYFIEAIRLHSF